MPLAVVWSTQNSARECFFSLSDLNGGTSSRERERKSVIIYALQIQNNGIIMKCIHNTVLYKNFRNSFFFLEFDYQLPNSILVSEILDSLSISK